MRVVCTICTDVVTEDFAAAPCGHTFHFTCLSQWLVHQKTCPQCRVRCLPRSVLKLFVDSAPQDSVGAEDLDPAELKEKLGLQASVLKHKDQALSEARTTLEKIREEMEAWQAQHEATHRKLKTEQTAHSALKKQLSVMQYECDQAKKSEKEAETLRKKMATMQGLRRLLADSREEVETLVKNYSSPSKLATFVVAMKRDYEALKERKLAVQREKDRLQQETTQLNRQVRRMEAEVQSNRARLSAVEGDLLAADHEKESLLRKVHLLERALESPGSKVALRRMLESPMPDPSRCAASAVGASPLLTGSCASSENIKAAHSSDGEERRAQSAAITNSKVESLKRSKTDDGVLLPVNKISRTESSQNFASGFNGMGGQANFAIPTSKVRGSKGLKFAPRPRPIAFTKSKASHSLPSLQTKLF